MRAKAVVWPAVDAVELRAVDTPPPGPNEVLVETAVTHISPGTERGWLTGQSPLSDLGLSFPFRPGYALAGRVIAAGSSVSKFALGDRVAAMSSTGFGYHASHVLVREGDASRVPDAVDLESALFVTLASVAQHGLHLARLELGEPVAVLGLGPIGLLAVALARTAGAVPIVALDPVASRRQLAARYGADVVLDPSDARGVRDAVAQLPGGGAAVVLEATARQDPLRLALELSRPRGRVVQLSGLRGETTLDLFGGLFMKGVQLIGGFVQMRPAVDCAPGQWTAAEDRESFLRLLAYGRLEVRSLITHRFAPADVVRAYDLVRTADPELIGALIKWSDEN